MIYCYGTLKHTLIGKQTKNRMSSKKKKRFHDKKKLKTTSALIHFNKQLMYMPHKREIYVWWNLCMYGCFCVKCIILHNMYETSRNSLRFSFNFISNAHSFNAFVSYYGNYCKKTASSFFINHQFIIGCYWFRILQILP